MKKRRQKEKRRMREREASFDGTFANDRLPKYNALYDRNLRHHFENRRIQKNLHDLGMIDREGRVLDVSKNKSKLHIIEQEFKFAEKAETLRSNEEEEMRRRVRMGRYATLENARQATRLTNAKQDRSVRQEILRATRGPDFSDMAMSTGKTRTKKGSSPLGEFGTASAASMSAGSAGGTFMTEGNQQWESSGALDIMDSVESMGMSR